MRRWEWWGALFCGLMAGLSVPDDALARTAGTVTIAQGVDISTGDPHRTGLTTDFNVLANIYDTLIERDASLQFKPGLALSWKATSPTTWEFRLRSGVRFHNEEPFNAAAVKFSLERGA